MGIARLGNGMTALMRAATCAVTAACFSLGNPSLAQVSGGEVSFVVVDIGVRPFIAELSRVTGTRINVDSAIRSELMGMRLEGSVDDILGVISVEADLDYFHFNGSYYVSPRTAAATRLVRIADLDGEEVLQSVREAGLPVDRFEVEVAAEQRMLVASGPPHFLAFLEAIVEPLTATRPTEEELVEAGRGIVVRRGVEETTVRLRLQ